MKKSLMRAKILQKWLFVTSPTLTEEISIENDCKINESPRKNVSVWTFIKNIIVLVMFEFEICASMCLFLSLFYNSKKVV